MEEIVLEAQIREEKGRAGVKDLRAGDFIPAVIYSHGKPALSVKVSKSALRKLVHQHRLESTIINLKIKDDKKHARPCLIKEIQYHPVHEDIVHVDFNEVSLTDAIKVSVPVEAIGVAIGVKQEGGSLENILWELEVECLPTSIPKNISIDVNQLKMGDAVHVKDVVFPSGVKSLNDPDALVLHIIAPMKEEAPVEAEVEGEAKQEPEVIKEKKEVPVEGAAEGAAEKGKEKK